ncbi:polysaccharide deacetylase family protein [Sedimenticola selenatireducens]|uniref:polysaccharide deacetylase family protein n=1 Tax=Sedimenticola selenatireducens TaxID=191960 RepID=UPI001643357C|nr:polysaccharide deacetylase family protein [Sedimenticola selenatireducens]
MDIDAKQSATLSIDLDNLWCYQRSFGIKGWETYPSFLEIALPRILDFLDQHELRLTVFIVGRDAENCALQSLLSECSQRGHEIGNHSYDHAIDLHDLPKETILADIKRAEVSIQNATGQKPRGFRGPAFGISKAMLEVLQECDYIYDTSSLPNSLGMLARWYQRTQSANLKTETTLNNHLYGSLAECWQPLKPYTLITNMGRIVELPVSTLPLLRLPFHGTYINYLADRSEFLANIYFHMAFSLCRTFNITPSFLLHATDFLGSDDSVDVHYIPGMRKTSQEKIALMSRIMKRYSQLFEIRPLISQVNHLNVESLKQIVPKFN